MADVIVVIGAGQIGQVIARRVGIAKHIVLADVRPENANAAADVLSNAGYDVSIATVNVTSHEAVHELASASSARGAITGLIHADLAEVRVG